MLDYEFQPEMLAEKKWERQPDGVYVFGKCCYFLDMWAFACSISHVPTRMTRLNRESITV